MLFCKYIYNIVMAPITVAVVQHRLDGDDDGSRTKFVLRATLSLGLFAAFIACHILEAVVVTGMWAVAWFFYLSFAVLVASVRLEVRTAAKINGNICEDFFASLFFYPNVALQLDQTVAMLATKDKIVATNGNDDDNKQNNGVHPVPLDGDTLA